MRHGYRLKIGRECNNSCVVCGALEKKAGKDRTTAEVLELIDNSDDHVIFPCNTDMRTGLQELLKHARESGKKVTLETNGRAFSRQGHLAKIRGLVDDIVLLDFGGKDIHEQMTGSAEAFSEMQLGRAALQQSGIPLTIRPISLPMYSQDDSHQPTEVVIEMTSACNFHCGQCFNKTTMGNGQEMDTRYIMDIIEGINSAGIKRVRFSGGEPLLQKDIYKLMAHAKGKGLEVWLNTNASLVTPEIARKLAGYVENVLVAFNGWDAESEYQWSRTPGAFRNKIAGVTELIEAGIPVVRTGTVATPDNIAHLDEIFSLIQGLGIKNWEVWRPIPLTKGEPAIDAELLISKLLRYRMEQGMNVLIANAIPFCTVDPRLAGLVCTGAGTDDGHSRLIVDPSGYPKPSYFIAENLGDPRNPMDNWNHPYMQKMRGLAFAPDACKGCPYLSRCKGGSRYVGKLETGEIDGEDPLMDRRNVR